MKAVAAYSEANFPKDTVCVFYPDEALTPGCYCLAMVNGSDEPALRRYMEESVGVVRLEPINPAYPTYWIKTDAPGRIIARLVLSIRKH